MLGRNTHFTIGVHALTALAVHGGGPLTSAALAGSVDTNPAFLRHVLSRLREAGLVDTKLGVGGGALLARPADQITLLDVYRATEGDTRLCAHRCEPDASCAVARGLGALLDEIEGRLDDAIARELAAVRVADLASRLQPAAR